jgi:hypothetical protein
MLRKPPCPQRPSTEAYSHQLRELLVDRWQARLSRSVGENGGRVAVVHNLEWRGLQRGLKPRVAEFGQWEPTQPISGAITEQATQKHHDHLVCRLGLATDCGWNAEDNCSLTSTSLNNSHQKWLENTGS